MSQESGFFNAQLVGNTYDRVYNAEQFAAYFASFIGNGVFGESMEQLAVKANTPNNMTINVSPGTAWINGWWYRNDEDYNLSIAIADGVLSRIDTVVLRWGNSERNIWLQVIQGELSQNPVAPSIQRNADYYDLKLCEVSVPAGTPYIRQSLITDTRLDNNVCGLVTGVVDQIDTTELYNQFRSQFSEFMSDNETEYDSWYRTIQAQFTSWMNGEKTDFNSWFDNMKGQLSEDAAGHLQLEIDDINNWITNKKVTYLAEVDTHDGSALAKRIYGMSVQDGTPTPDSPVEIQSAKADFRCDSKNLISFPYYVSNGTVSHGITLTYDNDGTIHLNGTNNDTQDAYFQLAYQQKNYKHFAEEYGSGKRLVLYYDGATRADVRLGMYLYEKPQQLYWGNEVSLSHPDPLSINFPYQGHTYYGHIVYIRVSPNATLNDFKLKPVVCYGDNYTDASNKAKAYSDKGISKYITTDLTLRAIEVASTDDYTYERDGKYYIADTVDWSEDRGYEITRRIKEITINSGDVIVTSNPRYGTVLRTAFNQNEFAVRQAVKSNLLLSAFVSSTYENFISESGNGLAFFDGTNLRLRRDSMASTADWSTYLQSNPVKVTGILITPTTEHITSEQAQALLSLKTYDEASYISSTGNIEPSVDLEYATSEMSAKALTGHNEGYIAQELEGVYGVKNLISYPYSDGASKTQNGITFTVNDDGSITVNGTSTVRNVSYNCIYQMSKDFFKDGDYILSCEGIQNASIEVKLIFNNLMGTTWIRNMVTVDRNHTGVRFTYNTALTDFNKFSIVLQIQSTGTTVDNLTVKPMLRPASIQSNEYQPYAMSNYELTKKIKELYNSFLQALTDLKSTAIAQAVGATGSTFTSVIATLATIVNRGAVSKTLGLGESYTVPQGYHNGNGKVSVSVTSQEKTITASRSQQVVTPDSGKVLSKVTVNKYPDASGTYTATSRGSALDMGATNNLRYVNTNGVPNTNSDTYTVTSNGTKDMGATNTNRYVSVNVPSGVTKILTGYGQTVSLGGSYDTKCVFIMRGGPCAIYNDSVVFDNNVNYEIIVFDSAIVNKKIHGVVSLGKKSSTDVSLGGTYSTQKILVSVSFDDGQTQRGFAVYGDHVNIQNNNGGYPQEVPYDIIIFN